MTGQPPRSCARRSAPQRRTRVDIGDLVINSSLDGAIARDGAMVFAASTSKQPVELYYRAAGAAP